MNHSKKSISFPDAIASTQELMSKIEAKELNEAEIENAVANLVRTKAGARGFFVGYLTGDFKLADSPSAGVINGLKSVPDVVSDLLVKNVAMSAAMRLTHLRNNDETAAAGSQTVNSRSLKLIRLLKMPKIQQELQDLESTIVKGNGKYQEFLTKWGYDREQQQEIEQIVSSIKI